MHSERIREAIGQAARNVLETMFFTMLEGDRLDGAGMPGEGTPGERMEPDAEPPASLRAGMIRATLTFSGEWCGGFELKTQFDAAREIAANFTGALDPREVPRDTVCEVMRELANMVCGSTLSVLDANRLFDLNSPEVTLAGISTPSSALPDGHAVARAFALDSGARIAFTIASEAFSPEPAEREVR